MTEISLQKFPKKPLKKMVFGASFFMVTGLFGQQNFAIKNIPEELKANANAVIRQESFSYTIKEVDKITITESHVISILNKAGEGLAAVGIVYNPTNRVSGIKVSVLDENGKEIKSYSKSDFSDVSYVQSSAIYTDDRLLYLCLPLRTIHIPLSTLILQIVQIQDLFLILLLFIPLMFLWKKAL